MYKKPEHRISRQAREEASEWFLTFRESERTPRLGKRSTHGYADRRRTYKRTCA